jgi:arabinan endo-1,5-alpha-L-arabinosidase
MKAWKRLTAAGLLVALTMFSGSLYAQQENIPVHDPCIIREDSTYYVFCTGRGIAVWSSRDLKHWKRGRPVFSSAPGWADEVAPGFRNFIWAPDISYYHHRYYLFYVVSAFGKNTSAIGLATSKTLDQDSPDYGWTDHGIIVRSVPGRDDWNAIDPNLIVDDKGRPWLDFGCFWSGIKLVRLQQDRLGIARPEQWYGLARRPRDFEVADTAAGNGAIEAPFIFHHDSCYYLFVSFDYCCRGIHSNYKMMVGRSRRIMGPYVDKQGTPMMEGGGSLLLSGDKRWPGVGSNAVLSDHGKTYLVFHAYDAGDRGRSKLRILPLEWDKSGWPEVRQNDEQQ